MDNIPTNDIKLASILISLGVPLRETDPITCVVSNEAGAGRKEVYTFWFDVSAGGTKALAQEMMSAYAAARDWKEIRLDMEHPLYWMKGVLENRENLLHWIRKKVQPMKIITCGSKTVLIGEHASKSLRDKFRKMI